MGKIGGMEELNCDQKNAVHHLNGPMLVIAGAGSGKTRVVTFRIAYLLSLGIPSNEILAMTFTNKASDEMRYRVQKMCSSDVLTSTFHSLGARILKESISYLYPNNFVIYDQDESEKLIKETILALDLKSSKEVIRSMKIKISMAKNNFLSPESIIERDPLLGSVYDLYQKKLKTYEAVDFDDLLYLPIKLFHEFPPLLALYQKRWSFILIDEYQDTNVAQHLLIKLLAADHHNVFAVGDPDQSIYSWRGAKIRNILHFEQDFPGAKIITLDQNYRSCSTILNAANTLIQHNLSRYEKNLWSTLGPGEKIALYRAENDREEAEFVVKKLISHRDQFSLDECVIFYRTNFQSRIFEDLLLKHRLHYLIVGGVSFYQRREIKDILSLLRIVIGGADFIAFARTLNIPKRGFGDTTIAKLQSEANNASLSIFDYCLAITEGKIETKLTFKQRAGLKEYVTLVLALREMVRQRLPLQTVVSESISRLRYVDYLKEDPESFEERRGNIMELISKASEWEEENEGKVLSDFLEELILKTHMEEKKEGMESVRLMTLHNGKGLEFSVVFIVGMEEGLSPLYQGKGEEKEETASIEEERRLFYVGMTRAKQYLYLTRANFRFLWGQGRGMNPSRFLNEIAPEYLEHLNPSLGQDEEASDFLVGETVYHRDFGTGIVEKNYETSLGLTYDIYFFREKIRRSIVAKYGKLIKSSNKTTC